MTDRISAEIAMAETLKMRSRTLVAKRFTDRVAGFDPEVLRAVVKRLDSAVSRDVLDFGVSLKSEDLLLAYIISYLAHIAECMDRERPEGSARN